MSLSCGPSVLRLSQSLVHTTSMAINLWREKSGVEREGGERTTSSTAAATLLTGHYVLCNDTLDDIHFGQVATGEDLLLPSNSCISYSWRNHKANLKVTCYFFCLIKLLYLVHGSCMYVWSVMVRGGGPSHSRLVRPGSRLSTFPLDDTWPPCSSRSI